MYCRVAITAPGKKDVTRQQGTRYCRIMKHLSHDSIWSAVVRRMRFLLSEKGMTRAILAERMAVDRGTITRWLKGERRASQSTVETLVAYMRALGMNPDDFFGGQDAPSEYLRIPWLEATASMGDGSLVVSKEIISHLSFRADWLLGKGSPAKMAVINAQGSSMEPTISDGSVVLIDESKVTDPVNGKIYFVCYGDEIYLKRLRVDRSGRVLALISDRDDSELPLDPDIYFQILGRALWTGKEL
jgi:phage repressor protein C with HTH and peptisase S24 domain